ncbi:ran-binding protein 3 [Anopheles aquasalis]|uniref:ran-binding protein 3 n=1 Tax=Anopheles aquasalis TaxID=42839 RepID=UPI00215B1E54|nr:ran-binding protein 3 [Anopheles aquasalis]
MANVERDDNMLNEEQESSQSNSSNGSSGVVQVSSGFQLKSSLLRQSTFGASSFLGGSGGGSSSSNSVSSSPSFNTGSTNSFNLKPSVLKPSQLSFGGIGAGRAEGNGSDRNGNDAVASTPASSNPFLKTQQSEEDPNESETGDSKGATAATSSSSASGDSEGNPASANSNNVAVVDPLAKLKSASLPKSNLFANVSKSTLSEASGFVFGQNVHERVTGENLASTTGGVNSLPTTEFSFATSGSEGTTGNGATDGSGAVATDSTTSTAAPAACGKDGSDSSDGTSSSREPKDRESLEEAARRYEESRGALKRKYEEVETITGEEDERNVVEIACKLFAFAKSNWEERGHGTLRLNDKENNESRVVFRQSGNLRVLINTKVWSGMIAQTPSPKSLRLTAIDSTGQIKVFLVMSRPEVISKLHNELTKRIEVAKQAAELEAAKENKGDNQASLVGSAVSDSAAKAIEKADDEESRTAPDPEDENSSSAEVPEDEPSAKKRHGSIASAEPASS